MGLSQDPVKGEQLILPGPGGIHPFIQLNPTSISPVAFFVSSGDPNGVITANVGSLCIDASGNYWRSSGGTVWLLQNPSGAWTAYTATITPSSGSWTPSSQNCAYQQVGKSIQIRIRVTGTPSTTPNYISISLPVTAVSTNVLAASVDVGNGGIAATAEMSTTDVVMRRYDMAFSSVPQDIYASGVYEAA